MAAPAGTGGQNAFDRLDSSLARRALGAKNLSARQEAWVRLNQMRNHQAMAALLVALPPSRRPARFLYAASGNHVAPLVVCALDPGARPYAFIFTEVDPAVREEIGAFLKLPGS